MNEFGPCGPWNADELHPDSERAQLTAVDIDRMRREGCSDEEYLALLDTIAALQQRVAALEEELAAAVRREERERRVWFNRLHRAKAASMGPRSAWERLEQEVTHIYGSEYTGEDDADAGGEE